MSKRRKMPTVNLNDYKDKLDREGKIPVRAAGKTFHIKPPTLLTDTEWEEFRKLADDDVVAIARMVVDDYDGFVAAGGSAMIVNQLIQEMAAEESDEESGEGEASSDS